MKCIIIKTYLNPRRVWRGHRLLLFAMKMFLNLTGFRVILTNAFEHLPLLFFGGKCAISHLTRSGPMRKLI